MTPTLFKLKELFLDLKSVAVYNEKHKRPISVPQRFTIIASELFSMCEHNEWTVVGKIATRLKEYNCLFSVGEAEKRNNSTFRASLRGLLNKEVIFRTEDVNIFFVNPYYIRKGETLAVLLTTINMLKDEGRVGLEHITDKRPNVSSEDLALS